MTNVIFHSIIIIIISLVVLLTIDTGSNTPPDTTKLVAQSIIDPCPGNATWSNDDVIDVNDLVAVIISQGATTPGRTDLNDDGVVNLTDLLQVIEHFGTCNNPLDFISDEEIYKTTSILQDFMCGMYTIDSVTGIKYRIYTDDDVNDMCGFVANMLRITHNE